MLDMIFNESKNLMFWLPLSLVWLVVCFIVGLNKWTYEPNAIVRIRRRRGYEYNTVVFCLPMSFAFTAGLATLRSLGKYFSENVGFGAGASMFSVFIFWIGYLMAAYGVGRIGCCFRFERLKNRIRSEDTGRRIRELLAKY